MRDKIIIDHNSIQIISSRAGVGTFILHCACSKILSSQIRDTATANVAVCNISMLTAVDMSLHDASNLTMAFD